MFLNVYYHDSDHPNGIALVKLNDLDYTEFPLINELYSELFIQKKTVVSSYYYEREQKEIDFGQRLVNEVLQVIKSQELLAKDVGWDNFIQHKSLGWVVLQLSEIKTQLYNDSFWDFNNL
jgi:hypothetical protein